MTPSDPALAAQPLEELVTSAPDLAPLARAWARAVREGDEPAWAQGVVQLAEPSPEAGTPVLQGTVLTVDRARLTELVTQIAADLTPIADGLQPIGRALRDGLLDPIALLHAAVTLDLVRLGSLAERSSLERERLGVVAQVAVLPLLLACQRQTLTAETEWEAGYCPVCGGWPTLAEMRGLEREHWLRCGRCFAGWQFPPMRCVFCGEENHEQRGYLAAESERESRRAMTCATCHGYLKTFATLAALSAADLLAKDLTSVELDLAALEADYRRPEAPGYRLELRIEPLRKRGGWLGWRS